MSLHSQIAKIPVSSYQVIECFGMPGSGKTYAADILCAFLRKRNFSLITDAIDIGKKSRSKRVLKKILIIFQHLTFKRGILKLLFLLVHRFQPKKLLYWPKLLFNWLYICAILEARSEPRDIVVLDQGLGQALWSSIYYSKKFIASKRDYKKVSTILEVLLNILTIERLLIVHVISDKRTINTRLQSRHNKGTSPVRHDTPELLDHASQVTENTEYLINYLAANSSKIKIILLNN